MTDYFRVVDIPASIFIGRKLEDTHVRHDQSAAGASGGDVDELEVCYEGELDICS